MSSTNEYESCIPLRKKKEKKLQTRTLKSFAYVYSVMAPHRSEEQGKVISNAEQLNRFFFCTKIFCAR